MSYIPVGAQDFGAVVKVDLGKLVEGSQLVNGFTTPLPSLGDIRNEIAKQNIAIISGNYEETGLMIGRVGSANDPLPISPITQQAGTLVPARIDPRRNSVTLGYGVYDVRTRND